MSKATTIDDTRAELWRSRLGLALRTTLACTIVGCATLYGPVRLQKYLEFSAFSYVTTILLVLDANLGDTIRGCWHVFCATLQVMILSIVGLQVVGPAHFTSGVAATAVAVSAFVVAVPEATHLLTKRIAFGQLVIVYVNTVIHGAEAGVLKHPIHVASITALGALASVLAMLFPYPRLAHFQVKNAFGLYAENASERFNHNLEAISASDNSIAHDLRTQSKSLAQVGAKLLQWIKSNLDGMRWERPRMRAFYDKLQDKEIPLRGMDIALSSCTSLPVGSIDEELRSVLLDYRGRFSLKLNKQASCFASFDATTAPESKNGENFNSSPCSLENSSAAYKHLPTSFFLYCVQLLLKDTPIATNSNNMEEKTQKNDAHKHGILESIKEIIIINMLPSRQNLVFAFKCSVSLGLAVFFGLVYDKENACWSGLTIAISFVTRRQPTFYVANARGQGTAMGMIYGVICSFVFHRFGGFSFLPLLPWVVFSCFLMHSRMYGQAGGVSAVLGALLVLGRKNYGPPAQFAIARITEATIALACFIVVEIIINPLRGTSLAKSKLSHSFRALQDCIDNIAIDSTSDNQKTSCSNSQELRKRQQNLKSVVSELQEFIEAAEFEPNFWFLPFHGACYRKILDSLSTTTDLLLFVAHSIENVSTLSPRGAISQDRGSEVIELFKAKVSPTLKCLEEITRIESLRKLERKWKKRNRSRDMELGERPDANTIRVLRDHEEADSIACSFLQQLKEMAAEAVHSNSPNEEAARGQIIAHYSCLGFCITGLIRETIKIENEVKELVMWENPSCDSSLSQIYCMINTLRS